MSLLASNPSPSILRFRTLTSPRQLLAAAIIGAIGGLLATVYFLLLQGALALVWRWLARMDPQTLTLAPQWQPTVLTVTTLGGLGVGLLTKWLGSPGEIAAVIDNIHVRHGRIDPKQTPSMIGISLVSIAAGGSAGPEAPLVQIIGSFASWAGDKLKLAGVHVRTFTFCGMGAAMGAFFGAPLGGALFAMELPHRRGIEYYEALLPAIVSALTAFLVFRSIVGYEQSIFHLETAGPATVEGVFWGIAFGAIGAGLAYLFAWIFSAIGRATHRFEKSPVLLAVAGGLLIGLLAQLSPKSLFWSEFQFGPVIHSPSEFLAHHTAAIATFLLLLLALVKMLAVGFTLHSGFRGGFIFPLMFIGASVGTAAGIWLPGPTAAIAVLATMAAVNVAITKTPVATTVLLTTLSGTSMMPVILAASVASLLLSSRLNLIRTQRSRSDAGNEVSPVVVPN